MNSNIIKKTTILALLLSTTLTIFPATELHRLKNTLSGYAASLVSEVPFWIPSWFLHPNEDMLFKLSEIKAHRVFWNAYDSVPGYRDFINRTSGGNFIEFTDIPIMDKDNFIRKYPLEQVHKGGKIPTEGYMDPSSGTSGRRTLWIRGKDEIHNAQKMMNLVRNLFLEGDDYVLINMFLPSAWSLGLMRGLGPNIYEAYETMKDLGTQQKYLIMGHTSLMKYFVKECPFDLAEYDVTFLLGGEHMSRALHSYFLESGVKKILSGYGASDIHFTVGIQEEFAQKLQELCWRNKTLKKALTGSESGLPFFFQYSPLQDYIEEVDGRLIFTDLDHMRVSPRIRYDLGDRGKILRMSFVQEVLADFDIELEPFTSLPLICLYGRVMHSILFDDIEFAFDDLELAVLDTELGEYMNQYAYNLFTDADGVEQLEFWVELKEGVSANQFDHTVAQERVYAALGEINHEFSQEFVQQHSNTIALKIYDHGISPMKEESMFRKAIFKYNVANK